jgi:hypothetical protein
MFVSEGWGDEKGAGNSIPQRVTPFEESHRATK